MKKISILFFLLCKINLSGQIQEVDSLMNLFFIKFDKMDYENAIGLLYNTNKWTANDNEAKELMLSQFNEFNFELVGNYNGFIEICSIYNYNCLIIKTYLLKYDRQPIRITVIFYKPNKKWSLLNFKIDDNIDKELKNACKVELD